MLKATPDVSSFPTLRRTITSVFSLLISAAQGVAANITQEEVDTCTLYKYRNGLQDACRMYMKDYQSYVVLSFGVTILRTSIGI